jgi:hypothetical protein
MPKNKISVWDYFEKDSFGLPQANCCKCRKTYGIFKELIKSIPKIHKMVESVALTTDLWTSNYSTISYDSYMPFFEREKISQYFFRYFTVSRNSHC